MQKRIEEETAPHALAAGRRAWRAVEAARRAVEAGTRAWCTVDAVRRVWHAVEAEARRRAERAVEAVRGVGPAVGCQMGMWDEQGCRRDVGMGRV